MNFYTLFFFLLINLFVQLDTIAQNNCPRILKKAQTFFDEGKISEVATMLESCLNDKNGFTKEEKIKAYKLLVLTWLYFNEQIKAAVLSRETGINREPDGGKK